MDDTVSFLYEVAVKPGQVDELRTLTSELVDSAQAETGALIYEWSLSDDASVAHVEERYADSTATMSHLAKFRETFLQRFLAAVEPRRLVVYGAPSDQVKEALRATNPVYMSAFEGFAR
jgi:quinol monooxygenase YgiN